MLGTLADKCSAEFGNLGCSLYKGHPGQHYSRLFGVFWTKDEASGAAQLALDTSPR